MASLLVGVFLAWAVPLWLMGFMRGRGAFDQHYFHINVVRQFLEQWPRPDFSSYPSATAPGYHLALAAIARLTGDTPIVLQLIASLFTIAMLAVVGMMIARRAAAAGVPAILAAALVMPLACSMYVIFPGVWLQPDNAGWLGVFAILALALEPRRSWNWLVAGAVILAALVFVRQNHLWAAAMLWAAAWLNAAPVPDGSVRTLFSRPARRITLTLLAIALSIPAIAIIAHLARLWDGLVPPDFQKQHASGANLATPAFILSLIAIYSVFFGAWVWPGLVKLWRESRPVVFLAAIAGAALALISPTTFIIESQTSGLWNVVRVEERYHLIIAGRTSPSLLILSTLGAVCTLAWFVRVPARTRWLLAGTLFAFVAAQAANSNCWQRYFEPFLLVLLPLLAISGARRDETPRSAAILAPLRLVGPLMLALLLAAITVYSLVTGETLRW